MEDSKGPEEKPPTVEVSRHKIDVASRLVRLGVTPRITRLVIESHFASSGDASPLVSPNTTREEPEERVPDLVRLGVTPR